MPASRCWRAITAPRKRRTRASVSSTLPAWKRPTNTRRKSRTSSTASTFSQVDLLLPFELGGVQHDVKTGALVRVRDRTKEKQKTVGGVVQALDAKEVYAIDETVWAGYILDEITFDNGLTIAPGVRFEASDLDAAIADGTTGGGNVFDVLPSLPVHFQATEEWAVDASVARLVNRPKFDNLIPQNSDMLLGNPDLDPERA
ncbi:TonB-dependent receptor [Rhizobium sp. SL42]|nr:TonB-dependent receptor [Rhizobium sp. SL42]